MCFFFSVCGPVLSDQWTGTGLLPEGWGPLIWDIVSAKLQL